MSKTVTIYNRSAQIFRHPIAEAVPGVPSEWFVLGAQQAGDVPVAIWEHWKKVLSKPQLDGLIVGGQPKDDNQKLTAAVDEKNEALAKLAAKEKELENLQATLAQFKAQNKK